MLHAMLLLKCYVQCWNVIGFERQELNFHIKDWEAVDSGKTWAATACDGVFCEVQRRHKSYKTRASQYGRDDWQWRMHFKSRVRLSMTFVSFASVKHVLCASTKNTCSQKHMLIPFSSVAIKARIEKGPPHNCVHVQCKSFEEYWEH